MATAGERVLSIQSHVAFGYVGGKAAVFPLQCLGYDVDVVNTVNFSNHSGYGRSGGSKTSAAELSDIFQGMENNELLLPTRLLTGYVPGAEALSAVAKLADKIKQEKHNLIYLLDPVIGDAGRLYVAADVIPVYRKMLPLASIITPNWYEAEVLTNTPLNDFPSLQRALRILHSDYFVPHIIISSIPLKEWLLTALPPSLRPSNLSEYLLCISSSAATTSSPATVHAHCVPLIPGYFSGVGDLFSALVLAHFHPSVVPSTSGQTPLSSAASQAVMKTHAILTMTYEDSLTLPEEERQPTDDELDIANPLRKTRRMRARELALVKGQNIIRGVDLTTTHTNCMKVWEGFWFDDETSSTI